MNVNVYNIGINRLFYKAEGFAEGKEVTFTMWNPLLEKSGLHSLEELEGGLYFIDFNFDCEGTWAGLFFENGIKKTPAIFRVGMNTLPLVRVIQAIVS